MKTDSGLSLYGFVYFLFDLPNIDSESCDIFGRLRGDRRMVRDFSFSRRLAGWVKRGLGWLIGDVRVARG